MTCKHCGNPIELHNGEWMWIKYQNGEGLIDGSTYWCITPLSGYNGKVLQSYSAMIPHEPSKNSIVIDILKDL